MPFLRQSWETTAKEVIRPNLLPKKQSKASHRRQLKLEPLVPHQCSGAHSHVAVSFHCLSHPPFANQSPVSLQRLVFFWCYIISHLEISLPRITGSIQPERRVYDTTSCQVVHFFPIVSQTVSPFQTHPAFSIVHHRSVLTALSTTLITARNLPQSTLLFHGANETRTKGTQT